MAGLGVPGAWACTDVYGLDDELLAMVPQPVLSLILLHPINDKVGPRLEFRFILLVY